MNTKETCIEYAKENLAECATELLEWSRTALLCNGKVRILAKMVSEWAGHTHDLQIAESLINNAALELAATMVKNGDQ